MKKEYYIWIRQMLFKLLQAGSFFSKAQPNFVLCYHSFSGRGNSYTLSPKAFLKQIKTLSKKYSFVSLDQVVDPKTKNSIAVTVDDGYEDIYAILPTLKKYQIPLTLFVLANPKKANRQELDHSGKLLTFSQIKQLQKTGVTIGCHSMTHANFDQLTKKELAVEIIESKNLLEKKLNTKIKYFAYPKGIFNNLAIQMVKKAGYKAAFTVLPGNVNKDLLLIPRTIIDEFYSADDIKMLFNPLVISLKNIMIKNKIWRFVPNI